MKLKQLVAKAMVVGGVGLPAVGLGIGVANADPPYLPLVPTPPPATPVANGNKVVPTSTATSFGGEAPRFFNEAGLNPRGWVANQTRLLGPLGVLIGPRPGLLGLLGKR
jgi:hypothetical protein